MTTYAWAPGFVEAADGSRPSIVTSRFRYEDSYTLARTTPPMATPGCAPRSPNRRPKFTPRSRAQPSSGAVVPGSRPV